MGYIICKNCNTKIKYKNKQAYKQAIKKETKRCRSCAAKKRVKDRGGFCGKNNPFYGKTHTEEVINQLKNRDTSLWKTDEFRKKMSSVTSGSKNPMYGKKVYDIWVKKYGEEKAKKLDIQRRERISKASSGKNNPMYGKPSPKGSGNGCGGWYNGFHFRSLRELNYILYLEKNNIKWSSADKKIYRVKYISPNGNERTYSADFLLEDEKCIIECKPKELWNTAINLLKKEAAIEGYKKMDLNYKVIDPGIIDNDELFELIESGKVKMMKKFEKKRN